MTTTSGAAPRAAGLGLVPALLSFVRFSHTIFALPFAFAAAVLAQMEIPPAATLGWILLAMIGARSLAMALNRLVDARIDARNPRTATRELPAGRLRPWQVVAFCLVALAVFLASVWQLDPLVRWLWPIPVAGFVAYPYLKRFTWLAHVWLGACLGLAPVGAWLAVSGSAPWEAWTIGAAVLLWVAGFDLFYSLYDLEHDSATGLHSWAVRFGLHGVFRGARAFHVGTVALLAFSGAGLEVGAFYWLGVLTVAALLAYEHAIVRPDDLRRLDAAFFTVNGLISIVFFLFLALDVLA